MGELQPVKPVVWMAAVFSQHDEAFDWTWSQFAAVGREPLFASERFAFTQTDYYQATMGAGLLKQFVALPVGNPEPLPDRKLESNQWERQYADLAKHSETRPLNIDPGYVTEAKLVLATTKDRDHRVYLRDGIYAEVTVHFLRGSWTSRPWTYPDYETEVCHAFLGRCREHLRRHLRDNG